MLHLLSIPRSYPVDVKYAQSYAALTIDPNNRIDDGPASHYPKVALGIVAATIVHATWAADHDWADKSMEAVYTYLVPEPNASEAALETLHTRILALRDYKHFPPAEIFNIHPELATHPFVRTEAQAFLNRPVQETANVLVELAQGQLQLIDEDLRIFSKTLTTSIPDLAVTRPWTNA